MIEIVIILAAGIYVGYLLTIKFIKPKDINKKKTGTFIQVGNHFVIGYKTPQTKGFKKGKEK